MKSRINNIPIVKPDLPAFELIESSLREIVESGKATNFGKYLSQFEMGGTAYLGCRTIAVSSGTVEIGRASCRERV